jgi:hypothetical protein
MSLPSLIGMVHLLPLPGSPGFGGDLGTVVERAVTEASILAEAGFDGVIVENFGDAPFHKNRVPPVTVAAMTRAVHEVRRWVEVVGVNVLRNDALAAVAIAAATGARFIRVNVLAGAMFTDQGMIEGEADAVARAVRELAPSLVVAADVLVKHAVGPPGLSLEQAALDTWERGGAGALIVSGSGTGRPVDLDELRRVRKTVPEATLLAGSGVTAATIASILELADGVIVGSSLKKDGDPANPVDHDLARSLVKAAR